MATNGYICDESRLNLLDFGARYYDPELCRWTSVDPMAEKYYGVSPYVYCNDNPVYYVDLDGNDGRVTGAGTKEDPYIIHASYYYQNNQFSQEEQDAIREGIEAYNKKEAVRVRSDDGSDIFVQFDLSVTGVDKLDTDLIQQSFFTDVDGNEHQSANFIMPDDDIEAWGNASYTNIHLNTKKIGEAKTVGVSIKSFLPAIVSHEVGHNLGVDHNPNIPLMNETISPLVEDGVDRTTYPKVTKKLYRQIITKINPAITNPKSAGIWKER